MTALNWVLDDHHIAIQCDTLVSVNDGGENCPAFTTTKYIQPRILNQFWLEPAYNA